MSSSSCSLPSSCSSQSERTGTKTNRPEEEGDGGQGQGGRKGPTQEEEEECTQLTHKSKDLNKDSTGEASIIKGVDPEMFFLVHKTCLENSPELENQNEQTKVDGKNLDTMLHTKQKLVREDNKGILLQSKRMLGSLDTEKLSLINNNKTFGDMRRANSQENTCLSGRRKVPLVRQTKYEEVEEEDEKLVDNKEGEVASFFKEQSAVKVGRSIRLFMGSEELKDDAEEKALISPAADEGSICSIHSVIPLKKPSESSFNPLRPTRPNTMPCLQRTLTLPTYSEDRLKSPRRNITQASPFSSTEETDFDGEIVIEMPPSPPRRRSLDHAAMMRSIPTFTVTINPMTAEEVTFVPDSPTSSHNSKEKKVSLDVVSPPDDDELRRCSIGSATSLMDEKDEKDGLLDIPRTLSIRRVSEISHIKELRMEVGMEHLASEFYEISREANPDAISLDSIHKTVFQRCRNKYMPLQRSTTQNKCFVIVTSGFTIIGIIYGFWYKNFGPGKDSEH